MESGARRGDTLYDDLLDLIHRGTFAAGSRLPAESELARTFRVSRPMIREALSRLRQDRLIMSRKGAGSFVLRQSQPARGEIIGFAPIDSLDQIHKCFEFRTGLEGEAAFWAARCRSKAAINELRIACDELEAAVAGRTIGTDADYKFHRAVALASDNDFFITLLNAMREPIELAINLARTLSLARPVERLQLVQAEHEAIRLAIVDGDAEGARYAMRTHVQNACSRIFHGSEAAGPEPLAARPPPTERSYGGEVCAREVEASGGSNIR